MYVCIYKCFMLFLGGGCMQLKLNEQSDIHVILGQVCSVQVKKVLK